MVSKSDFYVGNTARSECETRVKTANHGDFVVRQDSDGQFSLIVNDNLNVTQFKIRHANNQYSFGKTSFRTLDALIDNLRKKAIGSSSGKPIILKNAAFTTGRNASAGAQRATPGRPSADDRRRLLEQQQARGPTMSPPPSAARNGGPDGVKIVHLQRTPTYGLGIKITEHAEPGCKGCVIKAINNPALEQAGVLRVGQKICTVNGTRVDTMTLVQLTDMFKSLGSAQVGVVATDYMPPRITGTLKKKVNLFIAPIDIPAFNELDICATKRTAIDAAYRGKQFNRYLDILPNPSTAVPLKEIPMDPASTYINANYVRGHGVAQTPARHAGGHVPRNTYIAAQGPLPSTVASFIRMIWENDVKFIVQTTNFIENKKRKCERYFPSVIGAAGTREFDSISVTLTGTELRKGYKYSRLLFQKGSNKRNVEHFWFISWPDHGVPTDRLGRMYPNHVTDMLLHVRDRRKVGLVLWRVCLTCVAVSVFAAASPSPACRPHRQIGVSTAPGAVLIRLASPVPRCPLNGCAHRICAVKRMLPVHPQAVDNYASPLLVHCSAGVGRTGTFIVIDHVIAAIADKDRVDLIDIIKKCACAAPDLRTQSCRPPPTPLHLVPMSM
eukprot:m.290931 g.290931  ORF g.290931 m.290931 type:complete len:612 (+) comp19976_c0_seq35:509-2344(+)